MKIQSIVKIILLTNLFVQMSTIQAQELKLNYAGGSVTLPLDQNRNLNINPITGNVDVSTTSSAEQIGDSLALSCTGDVPSINLTKTTNGSTSANISWNLGNEPVYCVKSGLWSGMLFGSPIVANGNETVTANGNYSLTCHNAFGSNFDTEPVINIAEPASPPILNFNASPSAINSGDSVTLSWTIANSPSQCVKTGDWPTIGNLPALDISNGNHSLTINNVTLNRTYSLECTNSAGTSNVQSASVSIIGSNTWPSCSGASAAILNGNEDRNIVIQILGQPPVDYDGLYSSIYGGTTPTPWPGPLGANIGLNFKKNHYVAAQFTTPNESIDGKLLSQVPSNNQGVPPLGYTMTISECPGDFNVHLNQPACKQNFETFKWSTTPNPPGPAGFFCELEQNKTYYLNIVHSTSVSDNYQTTDCQSQTGSCAHLSAQSLIFIR